MTDLGRVPERVNVNIQRGFPFRASIKMRDGSDWETAPEIRLDSGDVWPSTISGPVASWDVPASSVDATRNGEHLKLVYGADTLWGEGRLQEGAGVGFGGQSQVLVLPHPGGGQVITSPAIKGDAGPPPTLVGGTTTTLPPGEPASFDFVQTGPGEYRVDAAAPGGADGGSDAATAAWITEGSETKVAVSTAIESEAPFISARTLAPTIQQTRLKAALQNNHDTVDSLLTSKPHTKIIASDASNETLQSLAGQTITNVPGDVIGLPGRTVWRGARTTLGDIRVNVTGFGTPPEDPGPVDAVGALVYIENPAHISDVQVILRGGPGNWSRNAVVAPGSSHSAGDDGLPLRQGFNLIRWTSTASNPANLTDITSAEVRFTGTSAVAVGYVVDVWVEEPAAPSILIVADWAAKSFWTDAYPDLKALGVPATLACRVGRLGTGVAPDDHMSVDDVRAFMDDNPRNQVSIHSWDGTATSSKTPEEIREDFDKAIAGLMVNGIYTDGALFRAAWTQNLASNADAVYDRLALARTSTDSVAVTPWPPVKPLGIPGRRVHDTASTNLMFDQIAATRSTWVCWIHGVTASGNANHISQANWDYFISRLTTFLADGGQAVTANELMGRHPVLHHPLRDRL